MHYLELLIRREIFMMGRYRQYTDEDCGIIQTTKQLVVL